jgi:hypothetical protein
VEGRAIAPPEVVTSLQGNFAWLGPIININVTTNNNRNEENNMTWAWNVKNRSIERGLFVQYLFFFRYLSGFGGLHPSGSSMPGQNDYTRISFVCVYVKQALPIACLAYSLTLNMEAIPSFETLIQIHQTICVISKNTEPFIIYVKP